MYIYENHMGGLYSSDYQLDFDDLYCEQCGDSDTHLGHADTWEEVLPMLMWGWEEDEYRYDQGYINELKLKFETLIKNK